MIPSGCDGMSCLEKNNSTSMTLSCLFSNVMQADFRTVARGMGNSLPPFLKPVYYQRMVFLLFLICPEVQPVLKQLICFTVESKVVPGMGQWAVLTLGITVLPVLQKSACCKATHKPFLCCRASLLLALHPGKLAGQKEAEWPIVDRSLWALPGLASDAYSMGSTLRN